MKDFAHFLNMFIFVLLCLFVVGVSAQEIPSLPQVFYGNVTAPDGTMVEARADGVVYTADNPVLVYNNKYGEPGLMGQKLLVQGNISNGSPVSFYLGGVSTGVTYPFAPGEVVHLDLTVTPTTIPTTVPTTIPTTNVTTIPTTNVTTVPTTVVTTIPTTYYSGGGGGGGGGGGTYYYEHNATPTKTPTKTPTPTPTPTQNQTVNITQTPTQTQPVTTMPTTRPPTPSQTVNTTTPKQTGGNIDPYTILAILAILAMFVIGIILYRRRMEKQGLL